LDLGQVQKAQGPIECSYDVIWQTKSFPNLQEQDLLYEFDEMLEMADFDKMLI
jgi:hypothetical protein